MKNVIELNIYPPMEINVGDIFTIGDSQFVRQFFAVGVRNKTFGPHNHQDRIELLGLVLDAMQWIYDTGYTLPLTEEQEVEFKMRFL